MSDSTRAVSEAAHAAAGIVRLDTALDSSAEGTPNTADLARPPREDLPATGRGGDAIGAALFDTAIGVCAIAWSGSGVIRFQLPEATPAATRARITRRSARHPGAEVCERTPPRSITDAIAGIRAHLAGELDALRWVSVDASGIPEFHRTVYEVARAIDPGRTLSYGQVAERVGAPGAAQAVGQALGRNPIPLLIPCHRVLAADHTLHGFSAPGGLDTKQRLLSIERTPGFGEPTLF